MNTKVFIYFVNYFQKITVTFPKKILKKNRSIYSTIWLIVDRV